MTANIPSFPSFKNLTLQDKDEINNFTREFPPYSDYNFISLWSYNIDNEVLVSNLNENLVIRFKDYVTSESFYSLFGTNEISTSIDLLLNYARDGNLESILKLIPETVINCEHNIHNLFEISEDRDNFDYILSTDEIINLEGARFANKRYKIHRFTEEYPEAKAILIDLSLSNVQEELFQVFEIWRVRKGKEHKDVEHELSAIQRLFDDINSLKVIGMAILNEGKFIGFSITEDMKNEYSIFHFVKADPSYIGLFEFIYKSTILEHHKRGCKYVNREQDLGIESLRASKESWRPITFLKKYTIIPKS